MAGIGEAGAILGTIQLGLSLAKTLYACVGDYRSARDDIISLATDIEATLTQAQELDDLVASNETSKLLNERGLKLAEKCRNDSKAMVQKLLKLLTKTGVPEREAQAIAINDIDASRFRRAAWVLFKPEVTLAKRELDSIKLQMLVARSCIEAQSATNPTDRNAAASRLAGLEKSRWLARRLLREAQIDNRKAMHTAASYSGVALAEAVSTRSEPPQPKAFTSTVSEPPPYRHSAPRRRPSRSGPVSARQPRRGDATAVLEPKPLSPDSLDGDVVERVTQQVERDEAKLRLDQERMRNDILKQLEEDERQRKVKEAADRFAREEAIETYKADVRKRLNATRARSERMRAQLVESFSHELDEEGIQNFIDIQSTGELHDDFAALMIGEYKAPPARTSTATASTSADRSDVAAGTVAEKKK